MPGPIPPQAAGPNAAPGAPAPQGPQQPPQSGGARQLVAQIHDLLSQFADVVGQAPQVAPEEKQAVAALLKSFEEIVTHLGSQPAGASKAPPQAPPGAAPKAPGGPMPMEAGAGKMRPMV